MALKEAQSQVYMFDVNGLLESTRKDLVDFQKPYAHKHAPTREFVAAIESIKPTTIIGVSTIGGAFNQKVVETMARINERPVILALSNPTEHAECTAEQAYTWSKGKAIYAAGVQFEPGALQRPDISAGTGEQLLHIPGCWHGNLRDAGEARDRRDVY
jgi:malate dehydrogenase (oxaloacetate-decarboxylating)(NADP+)